MTKLPLSALLAIPFALLTGSLLSAELSFRDEEGQYLDVLIDGKTATRYMYAHDTSDEQRHHETYKPYLHVFDAEGKVPITKGPGGQYTHHRGIFIGWNKIGFKGETYDRWHMKGGDIVHQKFIGKEVVDGAAMFTSQTHWLVKEGEPILEEERSTRVTEGGEGVRMIVDFHTKLEAKYGAVSLKGDPEHAGVHYRPANEVKVKKTVYLFPEEGDDPRKVEDLRWVGETYVLNGTRHSVVQMNHPENPKGTRWSAYRDYGRFGAFFQKDIPEGGELVLDYRFLIIDGKLPEREVIEKEWKAWVEKE
jgi:hypothetical protein